ncbi:man1-src1p-carboxy-terminal domain protein [Cystoisospora suis]|uniref:Man1-src1p-carboxy-terminal domain protein n=1 Tax=Cystoisospora suis TaxID=483139 RepID=A0A2C6LBL5_9APIC|nr:man1-src1p-carboxy-terminal domain protein [Cystoisospora suis]
MGTPTAEDDEEGASSHEQEERPFRNLRPRKRSPAVTPQEEQRKPSEAPSEAERQVQGRGAKGKKKKIPRRKEVLEERNREGGREEEEGEPACTSSSSCMGSSQHEEESRASSCSPPELSTSLRRRKGSSTETTRCLESEEKESGVSERDRLLAYKGRMTTTPSRSSSSSPPVYSRKKESSSESRTSPSHNSPDLSSWQWVYNSISIFVSSYWHGFPLLLLFSFFFLLTLCFLWSSSLSSSSSSPLTPPVYCTKTRELPADLLKEAEDLDLSASSSPLHSQHHHDEDCVPCPLHAVCLNGNMRCVPPYIRVTAPKESSRQSFFQWLSKPFAGLGLSASWKEKNGEDTRNRSLDRIERGKEMDGKKKKKRKKTRNKNYLVEICIEDANAKLQAQHVTEVIVSFLRAKAGEAQCRKIMGNYFFFFPSPWTSSSSPRLHATHEFTETCEDGEEGSEVGIPSSSSLSLLEKTVKGRKPTHSHPYKGQDLSSFSSRQKRNGTSSQGKKEISSLSWFAGSLWSSPPLHALASFFSSSSPTSSQRRSVNDGRTSQRKDEKLYGRQDGQRHEGDLLIADSLLQDDEDNDAEKMKRERPKEREKDSHGDFSAAYHTEETNHMMIPHSSLTALKGRNSPEDNKERKNLAMKPGSFTRWQLLLEIPGIEEVLDNDNVYAFTFDHFLQDDQALQNYSILVEENYSFQPLHWGGDTPAPGRIDRQRRQPEAAGEGMHIHSDTSLMSLFLREQRRSKGITYTYTYTGSRAMRPWSCTVYLIVIYELVPALLLLLMILLLALPVACWMRRVYLRRRLKAILLIQHRLHGSESFSLQHTSLAAAIYPGTSTIDLAHLLVREVLLFRRRWIGVIPSWWLCRLARDVDEVDALCHDLLLDTSIRVHTARLDDQNFWWIEEIDHPQHHQTTAASVSPQGQQSSAQDNASSPGGGSPVQSPSPRTDGAAEYRTNAYRDFVLMQQLASEPCDRFSPPAGSISVPNTAYLLGNDSRYSPYFEPRQSLYRGSLESRQADAFLVRRSSAHQSARRLTESMNPSVTTGLHGSTGSTAAWKTGGLDLPSSGGIDPCHVTTAAVGGVERKSFLAASDATGDGPSRTTRLPTLLQRASNIPNRRLLSIRNTAGGGTLLGTRRGSSVVPGACGVKDYSHAAFLALAERYGGASHNVVEGRETGSGTVEKAHRTDVPNLHCTGGIPGHDNTRTSRSASRRPTGYIGSFVGMGNSGLN